MLLPPATPLHLLQEEITNFPLDPELSRSQRAAQHLGVFAEGSGAGGVQTAKASRKQSSLSGKESAQGCLPKPLLGPQENRETPPHLPVPEPDSMPQGWVSGKSWAPGPIPVAIGVIREPLLSVDSLDPG